MKFKMVRVTPAMAAKYLESNTNNRNPNQNRIAQFARDMAAGHWFPNHQGIAFDEGGSLIDGQHRLLAIIASGMTVEMMVTTGVKSQINNGICIHAMDTVDRGQPRGVGQQLNLRHGIKNGHLVAACARVCAEIATAGQVPTLTTSQTLRILEIYGSTIQECISDVQMRDDRKAAILGVIAFSIVGSSEHGRGFASAFFGMENLQRNHPAMCLRRWIGNHPNASFGSARLGFTKVVASAVYNFSLSKEVKQITQSDEAMDWLRGQQKKNVRTICEMLA